MVELVILEIDSDELLDEGVDGLGLGCKLLKSLVCIAI